MIALIVKASSGEQLRTLPMTFQPEVVVFRSALGHLNNQSGAFLLADTSGIPTQISGLCIKWALLVELYAGDMEGYLCI